MGVGGNISYKAAIRTTALLPLGFSTLRTALGLLGKALTKKVNHVASFHGGNSKIILLLTKLELPLKSAFFHQNIASYTF